MKASELLEVFENFINYRYTPSDEGIRFGCDCGCGGEHYTSEDWDYAHEVVHEARKKLKQTLELLNIENDLEELK